MTFRASIGVLTQQTAQPGRSMSEQGRAAPVIYGAGASDCFQPKSKAGLYRLHFGRAIFKQTGPSAASNAKTDRFFCQTTATRGENPRTGGLNVRALVRKPRGPPSETEKEKAVAFGVCAVVVDNEPGKATAAVPSWRKRRRESFMMISRPINEERRNNCLHASTKDTQSTLRLVTPQLTGASALQ